MRYLVLGTVVALLLSVFALAPTEKRAVETLTTGTPPAGDTGVLGSPSLHDLRWHFLGALALVLTIAVLGVTRRVVAYRANSELTEIQRNTRDLTMLEDRLLLLEITVQQGRVSAEEYGRAKRMLERAIQLVLTRPSRSTPRTRWTRTKKTA